MTVKELKKLLDEMPEDGQVNCKVRIWGESSYRYYLPINVYKDEKAGSKTFIFIEGQ